MISALVDTGKPITEKNISADREKASAGSTSGDMNIWSRARAGHALERAIDSAAATPSRTEAIVVVNATLKEFQAADCSVVSSVSAAYHCSEKPLGGKRREASLVNDVMRTMMVGARSSTTDIAASSSIVALKLRASRSGVALEPVWPLAS